MRFAKYLLILPLFWAGFQGPAQGAATLLPNGEQCFQATTGLNGMVGLLGTITGGSGGASGTYGGVPLTGGSGSGATANITVSGGAVTAVTILNPGTQYVVGDTLSALSANIGSVTGFSVPISSVSINSALAGGTVGFYYPSTLSFKQTWFNADQSSSHLNTNPVQLDANGCAVIYGIGSYRQIVKDSLGNTIWDQITTDTSANNNTFWAGTAGGTPNAITVVDPGFNGTDGSVIEFIALNTNTGSATLNPSSYGAIPITKPSSSGQVSLAAGDIVAGNVYSVLYQASTNSFQVLSYIPPSSVQSSVATPQGYLTLLAAGSGGPIQTGDVVAATTVYYTPFVGNQVPIYNGSSFVTFQFSELTLTLTSSQLASTIYDVCVFSNSGSPTLVVTPAWSNSAAGAGARGTGAGSAQLQRTQGFWVNAVAITGLNGASSFSVPINQCTYLGSLQIDGSAGQVSAYRTAGQSRKFGVWNAYNRVPIILQVTDSTASWSYNTATTRASNGNSANSLTVFSGLSEELYNVSFNQAVLSNTAGPYTAIGYNSTTVPSGTRGYAAVAGIKASIVAQYVGAPSIGINTVTSLETGTGSGTETWFGDPSMLLIAQWRG